MDQHSCTSGLTNIKTVAMHEVRDILGKSQCRALFILSFTNHALILTQIQRQKYHPLHRRSDYANINTIKYYLSGLSHYSVIVPSKSLERVPADHSRVCMYGLILGPFQILPKCTLLLSVESCSHIKV